MLNSLNWERFQLVKQPHTILILQDAFAVYENDNSTHLQMYEDKMCKYMDVDRYVNYDDSKKINMIKCCITYLFIFLVLLLNL